MTLMMPFISILNCVQAVETHEVARCAAGNLIIARTLSQEPLGAEQQEY